jgi:anti-anti-sigma factor
LLRRAVPVTRAVATEKTSRQGSAEAEFGVLRRPPVVEVTRFAARTRVTLCGEIDLYNANVVADVLTRECDLHPRWLVVDLGAVDYLDSTALLLLLDASKRLAGRGMLLAVGPKPGVRRLLEISGLDRVLTVLDSDGDALHGLRCERCGYGALAVPPGTNCPMCGEEHWKRDGERAGSSVDGTQDDAAMPGRGPSAVRRAPCVTIRRPDQREAARSS